MSRMFWSRSSNMFSTCHEERFRTFLSKKKFDLFWTFERKYFYLWAKVFRQSCQNCIQRVHSGEHFGKNKSLKKFIHFLGFNRKVFAFLAKKRWQGCKKCFLRVQNTFRLGHFSFERKPIFFGLWAKRFWQNCQKCVLPVRKNILGK